MKNIAKRVLADAVVRLPWGARECIAQALFNHIGYYETLMRIAPHCHVSGFIVDGQYGQISGSAADSAVLRHYADYGVWAKHTNSVAINALRHGGTFLDIGANIGLTIVPLLSIPNIVIHAFEPEPVNLNFLRANVAGYDNVTVHPIALFDRNTTLDFEISVGNLGDHRIRMTDLPGGAQDEHLRDAIKVDAERLDDVLPEIHGNLVVKIDTQGAEPLVIEGGKNTLSKAEIAFVEFWPYGMARMNADPNIMLDFIAGFKRAEVSLDYRETPAETISIDEALRRAKSLDPANRTDEIDLTLYR